MAKTNELTEEKAASTPNHNRQYTEYKLDVDTHMRNVKGGGQELNYHMCEFGKAVKTDIFIEPKRALQMNRQFENRKRIYWPTDEKLPLKIKRIAETNEDGYPIWKDEIIYA